MLKQLQPDPPAYAEERPATVHDVFGRQAATTPHAVAVVVGQEQLTFARLDELSNQLAHRLRQRGVESGAHVGVCLAPSLELAVALLGVPKAGGAFVPLDPAYPSERLTHLIEDSGLLMTVTDDRHAALVPVDDSRLVRLDSSWVTLEDAPSAAPAGSVPVDGTACVIYTSGSTGSPKGVLVTHRGLVNLARAAASEFDLRAGDRFLQLASIGFSAFLEEVFPPLLAGATCVLAGYGRALSTVDGFVELLVRQRITAFEITTAYWHQVVDQVIEGTITLPSTVRLVVVGGDLARPDAVVAWRATGISLINVYGPTEATATGSYHHTGKEVADERGVLPIGRAIANTEMRVLDAWLAPVPPGEVGQIFLSGASLALGYHGAPAKTADVFVPDPFDRRGGRLYRTGDLGRLRPDGTVEFIGRVDNQVKIRGMRVEPGEIEVVLQRHPKVGSAVVNVSGGEVEDRFLVAHVTARGPEAPTEDELRAYLSDRLPGAMVPARFLLLDQLPVGPHGKVDREAVKALANQPMGQAGEVEQPRPGTEAEVAEVWSAVLGTDRIGRRDDFFALGGNSLQAVRIVAKMRQACGLPLTPSDLLSRPTVADLAARIDELGAGVQPTGPDTGAEMEHWRFKRRLVEEAMAARSGADRSVPAAISQQSLWILSRFQPHVPLYNEAWQCRLRGPLDESALRRAIADIAERHETWRTRFATVDGQPVQVVSARADVPVEFWELTQSGADARLREAYAARDELIRVPIDPAEPPLVRIWVFPVSADDHLLVMNIHHIIWDGIAKENFLDELLEHYEAHRTERLPAPPELPLQYGEFALWQRSYLGSPEGAELVGFWRDRLADEPAPLDLPQDRPTPPVVDHAGATVSVPLAPEVRDRVVGLAKQEGVTPFMLMFAALCHQLHESTGATDLCVGTPMANRIRPGIDRLLGCFINSVPLRVDLTGAANHREALGRVRTTCVDAIAHQGLPFDRLVEELRPTRRPGLSPFFQVWFAMEDHTLLPRESPGLAVTDFADLSTGMSTGVAKLDLNWIVVDQGDRYLLTLTYRTGLYDEDTVRQMLDAYIEGLEGLLADPASPFSSGARQRAVVR